MPKLFRMTSGAKLSAGIFEGETINTPSMLCVEDYIVALTWAKQIGGLAALRKRADANAAVIAAWVLVPLLGYRWYAHERALSAARARAAACVDRGAPSCAADAWVEVLRLAPGDHAATTPPPRRSAE